MVYVVVIAAIIIFRRLELLQRQLRTHLPLYCVLEVPRMRRGYDVRHRMRQVAVGVVLCRVVSAEPYQNIQAIDIHVHVRCAGSTSHAFTLGRRSVAVRIHDRAVLVRLPLSLRAIYCCMSIVGGAVTDVCYQVLEQVLVVLSSCQ